MAQMLMFWSLPSLPSRERGLKHCSIHFILLAGLVAPFTGAWIETHDAGREAGKENVAPFTGAWIETVYFGGEHPAILVAPFTGAWIETEKTNQSVEKIAGRSLHGSVD